MKAPVIRFPGNPRPAVRHGNIPVVVTLPVIRIERYVEEPEPPRKPRRRRSAPKDAA